MSRDPRTGDHCGRCWFCRARPAMLRARQTRKSETPSGSLTATRPRWRAPQPTRPIADGGGAGVGPAVGRKWWLGARRSSAKLLWEREVDEILHDRLAVVA